MGGGQAHLVSLYIADDVAFFFFNEFRAAATLHQAGLSVPIFQQHYFVRGLPRWLGQ